jgi:hypothetical protein
MDDNFWYASHRQHDLREQNRKLPGRRNKHYSDYSDLSREYLSREWECGYGNQFTPEGQENFTKAFEKNYYDMPECMPECVMDFNEKFTEREVAH